MTRFVYQPNVKIRYCMALRMIYVFLCLIFFSFSFTFKQCALKKIIKVILQEIFNIQTLLPPVHLLGLV